MTTTPDDDRLDAALARALGPEAADTAQLSRAVLSRMVAPDQTRGGVLAEVLTDPRPIGALLLGALVLAGALGYAAVPGALEEALLLQSLIGPEL